MESPPLGRFHLDPTFYGRIACGLRGTLLVNSLYVTKSDHVGRGGSCVIVTLLKVRRTTFKQPRNNGDGAIEWPNMLLVLKVLKQATKTGVITYNISLYDLSSASTISIGASLFTINA